MGIFLCGVSYITRDVSQGQIPHFLTASPPFQLVFLCPWVSWQQCLISSFSCLHLLYSWPFETVKGDVGSLTLLVHDRFLLLATSLISQKSFPGSHILSSRRSTV